MNFAASSPAVQGVILLAHGSRDPLWRAPIEAVQARIAATHPALPVRCAYVELCAPTLADAVADIVALGAGQVTVVPMFLGAGMHTRQDIPRLLSALRNQHPGLSFTVQDPIGEDPRMTALMAAIATGSAATP